MQPFNNNKIRKPNLFVVGFPKCGTTSLHYYLNQHPDVYMSTAKEVGYLTTDLVHPHGFKSESEYLNIFAGATHEKYIGEASTTYAYSKTSPQIIAEYSPDAKIVICIRKPVDALFSLHNQRYIEGWEDLPDIEQALAAETDRALGRRIPQFHIGPREHLLYRYITHFSEHIQRYLNLYGPERVFISTTDDWKLNPRNEFDRLCRFLGIAEGIPIDFSVENSRRQWRNPWIRKILLQRFMNPIRRSLPEGTRTFLKDMLLKQTKSQATKPLIYDKLVQEYRPEVERLAQITGRDLSAWMQ